MQIKLALTDRKHHNMLSQILSKDTRILWIAPIGYSYPLKSVNPQPIQDWFRKEK